MSGKSSSTSVLLWIFAVTAALGTLLALGLGFDLFVQPPDIPESMLFPDRLKAIEPYFAARWPYDAAATLLFVIAFGSLTLAADGIASLGDGHRLTAVLRASLTLSGILGVVGGLAYFGATKVTMDMSYCDCGFVETELISRFWALALVQGATDWLTNGAVIVGALSAGLSTIVLRGSGVPAWWSGVAWGAAALLVIGVVSNEFTDTPIGELAVAVATAILLPIWAIVLARRASAASAASAASPISPA